MSLKTIFEEERLKKAILIFFTNKNGKKSRKKFGLAFDSGLKSICDIYLWPLTQSLSRDFDKTSRPKASNGQWFPCPAGQWPRLAIHPGSLAGPEAWLDGPEGERADRQKAGKSPHSIGLYPPLGLLPCFPSQKPKKSHSNSRAREPLTI